MKTLVVYHSSDFDGIFCREIARKFLPHDENCDSQDVNPDGIKKPCNCTQYIGWNYGDPSVKCDGTGLVFILDLPVDKPLGLTNPDWISFCLEHGQTIVWVDHHKSSIESHPKDIPGYRIDGVAACRLAWQWFTHVCANNPDHCHPALPRRQDFIDGQVSEPFAVRLAGEYDVAGPSANEQALNFQYGLRSTEIAGDEEQLLTVGEFGDKLVQEISERGIAVRAYLDRADQLSIKSAFTLDFDGRRWLAINSYRANSAAIRSACTTEHDGIMAFCWRGNLWTVSLYDSPHRPDLDLSLIAKKYGGGGHAKACGFECKTLPFSLPT